MSDQSRHTNRPYRRRLLKLGLGTPLLLPIRSVNAAADRKASSQGMGRATRSAADAVAAVRMWPSREYTRVTLELKDPVPFRAQMIDKPYRVTLDLNGLLVDSRLRELLAKVSERDPYIRQIRIGQFTPDTLRIVFDLKQAVAPQIFTLKPAAGYSHRLVLDFYPQQELDPLDQLIASADSAEQPSSPTRQAARDKANGTQKQASADGKTGKRGDARSAPKKNQKAGTSAEPDATRIFTVVLDPGHGGEDPGAIGPKGTYEKDVVLAVSKRVRKLLANEKNLRVVLTRDDDYYVSLAKRVAKARGVSADLLVSVHADAFVKPDARGSSVFILSSTGASSVGAKWLAKRENRADLIGGINVKASTETASLLMDLYTTSQIRDSRRLAKLVLTELGQIGRLHKAGVEQANFAVLRSPDVPSILVETAFISNPDEEKRLRDPKYQDVLAKAIAKGILDYRQAHPPGPRGKMS